MPLPRPKKAIPPAPQLALSGQRRDAFFRIAFSYEVMAKQGRHHGSAGSLAQRIYLLFVPQRFCMELAVCARY